jgi:hypothetical protein
MTAGTFNTPIRLLVQVADREPTVIASDEYESTLSTDAEGRVGVIVTPDAVRDALRGMLTEALDKL